MATILLNKPFQVLSQFSEHENKRTLAEFVDVSGVYPAGRLDYDSEGALLLTDDGALNQRIASPEAKLPKTYLAQVEGTIDQAACSQLAEGVQLKDGPTRPAQAERIAEPPWLWPRTPLFASAPVFQHPGSS